MSGQCACLDSRSCLTLSSILNSFGAPINEEQAWSLCYQMARCIQNEDTNTYRCHLLTDPSHVLIHKDGFIHCDSFASKDESRMIAASECQLISSIGVVLFQALDYGCCDEEERALEPSLEILIERITSSGNESHRTKKLNRNESSDDDDEGNNSGDEGIERDSGEDDIHDHNSGLTVDQVIEMCKSHLHCSDQADSHFRAVCRALVAEALELSTFLQKISRGTKELRKSSMSHVSQSCQQVESNLDNIHVMDWARLWMQVIRDLRYGVKLKKVDYADHSHRIEYEMTPYEMLLDDIRSRRYKLNEVMVNGRLPPKVKKDAHDLILEFIRSRPPLVPAHKRQLAPAPPKQPTLYEKLMHSIRQQHTLRPTQPNLAKQLQVHGSSHVTAVHLQDSLKDVETDAIRTRKLIKPDLNLRLSDIFDNDDDEQVYINKNEANDVFINRRRSNDRYNTDHDWDNNNLSEAGSSTGECIKESRTRNVPSFMKWRSHNNNNQNSHSTKQFGESIDGNISTMDGDPYNCLNLTLKEVKHIRRVLTKAEMEGLCMTKDLREDLEKEKICFTCMTTRFSFFGSWPVKCKLCERSICEKCSTKMRIPTDQINQIPVYMLSPMPTPISNELGMKIDPFAKRMNINEYEKLAYDTRNGNQKRKLQRAFTLRRRSDLYPSTKSDRSDSFDAESGILFNSNDSNKSSPLMKLCQDCKLLVRQICHISKESTEIGHANECLFS